MRVLFILLLCPFFAYNQCYNRYLQELFPTVQTTTNISYGLNTNSQGDTVQLSLDFYEPANDPITKRPLLILLHGPDLVNGSKEDSLMVHLSEKFAKRGFAVAAINYRKAFSLHTLLDKDNLFRATLQAAQDAKAAVRFFRQDAQSSQNYAFDSTMIWLGGVGAGSMAAQMAVYLNDTSEIPAYWQSIAILEGGLEGNSGTPSVSSEVRGVINLSGALIDTTWMHNHQEPLINIHGDMDDYYSYQSDSLFAYTHNNSCNGHHELCYKRLNEVTFVHTHNSHANDNDFTILAANQNGDIPAQFAAGVRALGIKLYYTSSFFCGSGTDLYAYHGNPVLGCIRFSTIGAQILDFLNNNPNEFLFITVEGSASNSEIEDGFNSAGLTPFLYEHTFGETWPTIGELIASGKRLIVMTDNSGPHPPGYHHMWTFMQDTEYNFQSTNDFNCNYLRGNTNADLFLLNHFLTIASPQPLSASSTNAWDLVLDRARQCGNARGLHPNFLYIDFFNSGDVFRAADSLNQIGKDFPLVHGSHTTHHYAVQQGILSELYTLSGQGYAPYTSSWGDSAVHFIADFMIRHFPCEMSCATPVQQIMGSDSIWKDSSFTYQVNANQGASYQWISPDSTYTGTSIQINTQDTTGSFTLYLVETSQYGCVYDSLSLDISILLNTSIHTLNKASDFVKIYPNPAKTVLNIELIPNWSSPFYDILIYNQLGELILQKTKLSNNQTNLDISNFPNGIYWLKIRSNQEIITTFSIAN